MRITRVSVESSSRLLGTTLAVDPLVTISALTSWSSTFEIVEKVSTDKLELFAEYYHRNIYPDFKVKAFSCESDRQWQEVEEAPYHLVIVFLEPSSLESRELPIGQQKPCRSR